MKLANRELGTVEGIGQDGRMSLKMDGGRESILIQRRIRTLTTATP